MEIAKKGKFVTDFYGSRPALGYEGVLSGYIETGIFLEDARILLVCLATKLELKGDEKKAFSSVVDFLTKRIVKLNNQLLTEEVSP